MASPALFDRLIPTLRALGLKDAPIWQTRSLWLKTPSYESVRPCPICLNGGRRGRLTMTNREAGAECLQCGDCGAVLKLPPTIAT